MSKSNKEFFYGEPYKASKFTMQFMAWRETFIGARESKNPMFHYALVDTITGDNPNQLVESFRGSAKSTTVSCDLPLFLSFFGEAEWFGKIDYMMIISETSSQATDLVTEIYNAYNASEELQVGMKLRKSKLSTGAAELEFENQNGHITNIVGKGAGQSMRGIKRRGFRPQIFFVDDLEDDEAVMNKENRRKLKNWFFRVLKPARDPVKSKFFFVGTPLHDDSLLSNLSKDEKWKPVRFPIIDSLGVPAWKDRFSVEWIENEKADFLSQGEDKSFYQEYMLQVIPEGSAIFNRDSFQYYKDEDIKKHLHSMNIFTTVDNAISKKETADFTVINTIAVNSDNHWFILNQNVGRYSVSEAIEQLFKELRTYKPLILILEDIAFQAAFKERVEEEMIKRNSYVRIETTKKRNKEMKIQSLEPRYKLKTVHHPFNSTFVPQLEEQLVMFRPEGAMTKHDDQIDALSMADEFAYPPSNDSSDTIEDIYEDYINPYLID